MIEKENVKARLTKLVEMVLERATPLADPALIAAAKELDIDLSSTSIRRVEQVFLDAVKSIHTTLDAHSGSRASRSVLREALDRVGRLEFAGLNPTEQRTRLISQFDIGVGRNKVQLDLGDSLPLHFLQLSNLVAEAAFGSPAVNPNLLAYWERWPELGFHDYRRTHSFVGVNGLIPRSLLCPREVQEQMGVHQVALPDLAVAHAAYRIVTGGDLFGGFAVRARGGTVLLDSPRGLESFLGLSDSAPVPIGGALTLRRTVVHTAKAGPPSASEPGGGQS